MAEVQLALQRGPAGIRELVVVKLVHENLARPEGVRRHVAHEAGSPRW